MEKELCLKFLVHLHKCSVSVLKKEHIDEVDITYINNEIETFHKKMDWRHSETYDKVGALRKVVKIKEESATDKAKYLSKMVLKHQFWILKLVFGTRDEAHVQREEKVLEFKEKIRKIIAVVEYSS